MYVCMYVCMYGLPSVMRGGRRARLPPYYRVCRYGSVGGLNIHTYIQLYIADAHARPHTTTLHPTAELTRTVSLSVTILCQCGQISPPMISTWYRDRAEKRWAGRCL